MIMDETNVSRNLIYGIHNRDWEITLHILKHIQQQQQIQEQEQERQQIQLQVQAPQGSGSQESQEDQEVVPEQQEQGEEEAEAEAEDHSSQEESQEYTTTNNNILQDELSEHEYYILWRLAPIPILRILLQIWPDIYKEEASDDADLIQTKMIKKEWDELETLIQEFPNDILLTENDMKLALMRYHAPLNFLNDYWKEIPILVYSIHNHDWERIVIMVMNQPQLARKQITDREFDILWKIAPIEVICALLEDWSSVYEENDSYGNDLLQAKIRYNQWGYLTTIIHKFPHTVTGEDINYATHPVHNVPLEVFEMLLEKNPISPIEYPSIIFHLIAQEKLQHFMSVLKYCPGSAEVKEDVTELTPLLKMFQNESRMNTQWIGSIIDANPTTAQATGYDGKYPLHLAYQHGASAEVVNILIEAYPEAEDLKDNIGRTPKDLADRSSKNDVFTPCNEALVLADYKKNTIENNDGNDRISMNTGTKNNALARPRRITSKIRATSTSIGRYPLNAVVVCRADMLMRDLTLAQHREDGTLQSNYSKQVRTRDKIFETLLDEFSKLVGVDDKDTIQKAATIQALAVDHLSKKNDTIIDFNAFEVPGYWYQQEILKLAMRVYNEVLWPVTSLSLAINFDASVCLKHLERSKRGKGPPKPSHEHTKAFGYLTTWLTDGFEKHTYSVDGPVLKPLQSLFNKLFIRRGQTNVQVIGDLVRATLLVDEEEMLQRIITKIETNLPNITSKNLKQPDNFDDLGGFLDYVHTQLKFLPGSNNTVLPYRFKTNSSQDGKEVPLWFNFNFFLNVPEYLRVGQSEMFVAMELQIGLASVDIRSAHKAYERERILSKQPLLRTYDTIIKDGDETHLSSTSNCSRDDLKLIEKVLYGRIATEVLVPSSSSTCAGKICKNDATMENENNISSRSNSIILPNNSSIINNNHNSSTRSTNNITNDENVLWFESGPFSLSRKKKLMHRYKRKSSSIFFVQPQRLCINSRSLNWHASSKSHAVTTFFNEGAVVVAGPYQLDKTKRYFVDSFELRGVKRVAVAVGLYAHVGSYYSVQVAYGSSVGEEKYVGKDLVIVESGGQNFKFLEQACPIPIGTTAIEVIAHGYLGGVFSFDTMELSLREYDIQKT